MFVCFQTSRSHHPPTPIAGLVSKHLPAPSRTRTHVCRLFLSHPHIHRRELYRLTTQAQSIWATLEGGLLKRTGFTRILEHREVSTNLAAMQPYPLITHIHCPVTWKAVEYCVSRRRTMTLHEGTLLSIVVRESIAYPE